MSDAGSELLDQLEAHEAGVADLIAAYELAERRYFAAVHASAPYIQQPIASNSAYWVRMPTRGEQLQELRSLKEAAEATPPNPRSAHNLLDTLTQLHHVATAISVHFH